MEDISSLFNYRDPRSMRADQYSAQMRAPSGNLDEMTVQLGGNAGSLIGNALFGGQTSKMAEQGVLNEAIKESEVATDPDERLSLFAQALRKRGLEGYAQKVDAQLQGRMKTRTDAQNAQQHQMSLTKLVMDKTGLGQAEASALAQDPAVVRKLMEDETQVVDADGRVKLIKKNDGALVKDLGAAADKRSLTKVTVNGKEEESEFAKQLGKVQATRLGDAYDKRSAALRELDVFKAIGNLPDTQLISGSLAEPRIEIANFLNTIGLASQEDAARLSGSQQFTKLSNDLILSRIKQLGHNPSNADLTFIKETIPRLGNSLAARKALTAFMTKIAQGVVDEVGAMEEYGIANKTLTGYKPKVPQVSFSGSSGKAASDMTDAELLEALKKSKK